MGQSRTNQLSNWVSFEFLLDSNLTILLIDKAYSGHSTIRIRLALKRQLGDYILNVYLLQIFLLILCVASFWISVNNIVIRLSLAIIVLIIIKFQTIQTLKDERHSVVSALSVWTFGLSVLVIVAILLHILSYYSVQNKWNDKLLERLSSQSSNVYNVSPARQYSNSRPQREAPSPPSTPPSVQPESIQMTNPMPIHVEGRKTSDRTNFSKHPTDKVKSVVLAWFDSLLSKIHAGKDTVVLVDIVSRLFLTIVYTLFVTIYFVSVL